jgi:hypothetical protein
MGQAMKLGSASTVKRSHDVQNGKLAFGQQRLSWSTSHSPVRALQCSSEEQINELLALAAVGANAIAPAMIIAVFRTNAKMRRCRVTVVALEVKEMTSLCCQAASACPN